MVIFSNCKINLGLWIKNKRPDGYHNLETVFYPVNWCDALEIVKADTFDFKSYGLHIPGDPTQNIIVNAWKILQQQHQLPPVNIALQKAIPIGAGLGGGSANAAFTIKALNELLDLKLSADEMKKVVSQLGADCAFFVDNQPVFASGTGDIFEPVDLNLSDYQILVIYPRKAINTAWAFTQLQLVDKEQISPKNIVQQPIEEWKNQLTNDFEKEVIKVMPEIKTLKNTLYENGAQYASMSGSGSSVYGIFEKGIDLEAIKPKVDGKGYLQHAGDLGT